MKEGVSVFKQPFLTHQKLILLLTVFIHLDTVYLNQARVAQRISEGGHNVPDEKVASRIPRILQNIKKRCRYASRFVFSIIPELIVHFNK